MAALRQNSPTGAVTRKGEQLGGDDARYTLGLVQLSLGDKNEAIEYLEIYSQTCPTDERPKEIIAANKSCNIKFGKAP